MDFQDERAAMARLDYLIEEAQKSLLQSDWKTALTALKREGADLRYQDWELKLFCCCYLQAGRWDFLSNIAAAAAQRYPYEAIFWECWAWGEHHQGRTLQAIRLLELEAWRFESRESVHFTLSCLHASAGLLKGAEAYLMQAMRLNPDFRCFAMKVAKQPELHVLFFPGEISLSA